MAHDTAWRQQIVSEEEAAEAVLDAVLRGGASEDAATGADELAAFVWLELSDDMVPQDYKVQRVSALLPSATDQLVQNDHLIYELFWDQTDSHIVMDVVFRQQDNHNPRERELSVGAGSDGTRLTEIGAIDQLELLAHPATALAETAHEQWMVSSSGLLRPIDSVCQTRLFRLPDQLVGVRLTQLLIGCDRSRVIATELRACSDWLVPGWTFVRRSAERENNCC